MVLCRDIGLQKGGVGVQCYDVILILTFDVAVVTLTFRILPRLYLRNCKV